MTIERKVTHHSAASASATGTVMNCTGLVGALVQITGTFSAIVTFRATVDGTNFVAIPGVNVNSGVGATTTSAAGLYWVPFAGARLFRCDLTWTSGTSITVTSIGVADSAGLSIVQIPNGVNIIGRVGSPGIRISVTPTVTAGAYTAGDAVGGLLTFANAGRLTGLGGVIKDVLIIDDAGQDVELELWLFNATFTAMADNAAWAPSEADLRKLVAIISTSSGAWFAAGTPSAARIECSQRYDVTGTSLFGQLVTRGAPTFAATDDVTVIIGLLQD
jgi:hypothetical protein